MPAVLMNKRSAGTAVDDLGVSGDHLHAALR